MTKRLLAAFVVAACACADNSSPVEPTPPAFTITPLTQWSGGEIQVTSAAFSGTTLPILLAGAETLAVARISDSVVSATVPLGSSGTVAIEMALGKKRYPAGEVTRVGFRNTNSANPLFGTELMLSYDGLTPIVVGGTMVGTAYPPVQTLNLGTMEVTGYPGISVVSPYGISPTFNPNEFVVLDSSFKPSVWRLWPTPEFIDTLKYGYRTNLNRQLARLSDSVWINTSHHQTGTALEGSSGLTTVTSLAMESPWVIVISPRGDRATLSLSSSAFGIPVYNALTGDTAFSLGPQFRTSYGGAGFSPDGERIYFLGGSVGSSFGDSLLSVRAATGEVLAAGKVPPIGLPFKFATDPVKDLEYVEVLEGGRPTILIYDQNLKLLGRLPVPVNPATPTCGETCIQGVIAADRDHNMLHVVWNGAGTSNFIWTYDLLP